VRRQPGNEWPTGFNGDGHVSAFRFANGAVDFTSRYVKTDRLMTERKARNRLWGVYRNPYTDDPSVANTDRGAANTRKGTKEEGDGYVLGIASNYAEMASELHIVDARRMGEGAVAVVKLPIAARRWTSLGMRVFEGCGLRSRF
jgi:carotenoid cleavage dioxygenase-like enzyme